MEFIDDLLSQTPSFLLGGIAGKLVDFVLSKKKNDAETDVIVSDNWKNYAEKIEQQFEKLRIDYEELGNKYFTLLNEYREFKLQVLSKEHEQKQNI